MSESLMPASGIERESPTGKNGERYCAELREALQSPQVRVVFHNPETLDSLETVNYEPRLLAFRGGSAHEVLGANVEVKLKSGESQIIYCAVKKHNVWSRGQEGYPKGLREFDNNRSILDKGLKTLQPLAFVTANPEIPTSFVLTMFEPDLLSGDRFLAESFDTEIDGSIGLVFNKTAQLFAQLHNREVSHGDPQWKNLGYSLLADDFFFYDWEAATIFDSSSLRSKSPLFESLSRDIRIFFYSSFINPNFRNAVILSSALNGGTDIGHALGIVTRGQGSYESVSEYIDKVSTYLKRLNLNSLNDEEISLLQYQAEQSSAVSPNAQFKEAKSFFHRSLGKMGLLGKVKSFADLHQAERRMFCQTFGQLFLDKYLAHFQSDPEYTDKIKVYMDKEFARIIKINDEDMVDELEEILI